MVIKSDQNSFSKIVWECPELDWDALGADSVSFAEASEGVFFRETLWSATVQQFESVPKSEPERKEESPEKRPVWEGEAVDPSSDLLIPSVDNIAEPKKITKPKLVVIDDDAE